MARPSAVVVSSWDAVPPTSLPIASDGKTWRSSAWGLPEWFVLVQVLGPALLFLPGTQMFRVPLRISVFGISLLGLVLCLRRPRTIKQHPSWILLVIAAIYMTLSILHPNTNTVAAGMAQVGLHLAVAAPIYWAPVYFLGDSRRLAKVLTILWALNVASSVVGILQVRDPATWMPAELSNVVTSRKNMIDMYKYNGGDGRVVIRPPGLGDTPGAACGAGIFVAAAGLAFLGLPISNRRKLLGLVGCTAGVTVIFLTHVRSAMVVLIGSVVVNLAILVIQRRLRAALLLTFSMALCGLGSIHYASSLGGRSTVARFASLLSDDPLTVYEKSHRLGAVNYTFGTLLVDHPLGAGLGRWGMMRNYFGDESNIDSSMIGAEIQFAAWALDGGIVILGIYLTALVVAILRLLVWTFRHPSNAIRQWGAVIIMLSAGPIALLFSFVPFNAQMGMQFWFLIGAFEGVIRGRAGHHGLPPRAEAVKPANTTNSSGMAIIIPQCVPPITSAR